MQQQTEEKAQIIFFNAKLKQCGVYQYGKNVFAILQEQEKYVYNYVEIENMGEYNEIMIFAKHIPNVVACIYNYHGIPMHFINKNSLIKLQNAQNIVISHETPFSNISFFDKYISVRAQYIENQIRSPKEYAFPRPIYKVQENLIRPTNKDFITFCEYGQQQQLSIPIFGSFGFGYGGKGFDTIIKTVNEQYDYAIIKFVITLGDWIPLTTYQAMMDACRSIPRKAGIELFMYTTFVSNSDILYFLSKNTLNLFIYDKHSPSSGNSSTIDYAISVNTPFGISDSYMFEHIYDDSICVFKRPLCEIIGNSLEYTKQIREKYSHKALCDKMEYIILA